MPTGQDFTGESLLSIPDIDACLPQTQCTQCGFPRCHDYATALFRGETEINRCPPGGEQTITALARLLGSAPVSLNTDCGAHKARVLAVIVEKDCIGCKLCILACPVDAIVGRAKRMHTVLPEMCTGCELCLPVCPVDCIDLVPDNIHSGSSESIWPDFAEIDVRAARRNTLMRRRRMNRIASQREQKKNRKTVSESEHIRAEIRAAVARVNQKRVRK